VFAFISKSLCKNGAFLGGYILKRQVKQNITNNQHKIKKQKTILYKYQ
jgi:hypothetical protein